LSASGRHHPALRAFPTRRSSDLSAFAAQTSDGASRARTGDLLGAITPHRHELERMPLGQALSRTLSSMGFSQFGSTVGRTGGSRSEEHTSELQSRVDLVCRLLLE